MQKDNLVELEYGNEYEMELKKPLITHCKLEKLFLFSSIPVTLRKNAYHSIIPLFHYSFLPHVIKSKGF